MNFDYDEISQSKNRQKDLNKIHLIKECSNQFNKEKQNLSAENETNDETVKKSIENNFKLDLNDDIYNNEDSVFQEGNNSVTEQSLNFFENKSSQIEDNKNVEEKNRSFLGKKTERNNKENEEIGKVEKKSKNKSNNPIFDIKKEFDYRLNYFKMAFMGDFLYYVKEQLNKLLVNCNFCKKFGKEKFHGPNRKLYAGNPKEEDNREFIEKTIEEVFTDYKPKGNKALKSTSRQENNETLINKIKEYQMNLSIKLEKDEKYLNQFKSINILLNYLKKTIKEVTNDYYDSDEFKVFKSDRKIRFYDDRFYYEKKRKFYLLEKNNFVLLVQLPYYSNKKKKNKDLFY
jgi:hypothetical protein